VPIACLKDNYAYLVLSEAGDGDCLVVDPSEAAPVHDELARRGLRLRAILNTHHHWDHVGGNLALVEKWGCDIIGHESDRSRIPGFTRGVRHGDEFEVAACEFRTLHVPGHTSGAVTYVMGEAAFTGDTLFCGGCGRLFEGSAAEMHHSLTEILGALSDDTVIYCGHEYTEANLRFARTVQEYPALERRLADTKVRREQGSFCASATLAEERLTNPFLRCHLPEMQAALGREGDPVLAFAALRSKKDRA